MRPHFGLYDLQTTNHIDRDNILFTLTYKPNKEYRRIAVLVWDPVPFLPAMDDTVVANAVPAGIEEGFDNRESILSVRSDRGPE